MRRSSLKKPRKVTFWPEARRRTQEKAVELYTSEYFRNQYFTGQTPEIEELREGRFLYRAELLFLREVQESWWRIIELEKCLIKHKLWVASKIVNRERMMENMKRKAISGIVLMLLLTSVLSSAFNIHPVRASATITAIVNIEPDKLNLASKIRWVNASIQLPEPYKPYDIDVSVILLEGAFPPDWGSIQENKLVVGFDGAVVINMIWCIIYYMGLSETVAIELTITGNLFDGTPFAGSDTILVYGLPDNFADLGNLTDGASHNLQGWGAAQGPPENPYVSPSGDRTKRYQLLRGDNSVDLMVDEANVPYFLTAEVEDGYCTDNFEIYINGEGPIYEYIGKNVGTGPVTAVRHEVLVPADYITARMVTITFRNTATDDCGLAAVYNVGLTPAPPPKFRIGEWVQVTANLNVREGPGLSYTIISTMPLGTIGQIVGGPVEADGFVWWDVDYVVGVRGWSAENWLELVDEPPEKPRFLTLPFKDSNIMVGWIFDPTSDPPHYGIDFIKGSDIYDSSTWQSFDVVAAADGEAFWAEEKDADGNYKGWGKYVYVKHDVEDASGRNCYTLYAHLESVNPNIPREGEGTLRVWRGETVGRAGDTGSPGLIHLHFEVHKGDARSIAKISDRVDPYDLNQDRDSLYGEKAVSIRCGQNYLWITDPPFPPFNYPAIPIIIHYPSSAGLIRRFIEGLRAFLTSSGYFEVGEDITFYGSLSGDLDGEIISYEWDFGDGIVKSGKKVEHTYSQEGTYTVTLTVVDDRNEKSRRSSELFILDPTPELIEKLKQNINVLSDRSINYLTHDVLEGSKKAAGAADSFRQAIDEGMIDLIASLVFELIPSSIPKENPLWQKIAEEILDETAEAIQKWLLKKMISYLETEYSYYDLFIGDVENEIEDRVNSIADVTDELLNEIENLDLTPKEIRLYQKDLRMRQRANLFLSQFYGGQADLLYYFDEIKKEDANSWTLRWGKRIYGVSATFLSLKTGFIGTGLKFTIDRYSDLSSLNVNAQTFLLSHYILQRSVFNPSQDPFQNVVDGIYQNTIQGLENIRNERRPNIVEGRINSIEEDGNTYRIEIENTGRDKAEYKLIVGYETTYTSYELLPGIGRYYNLPTYTSDPADEDWIKIELHGKETIEIEIPKESSYVVVWLLGKSDTGIYGLDHQRRAVEKPWHGLASSWINFQFGSPGEPRVYDSQGRVTGLVNGEIREEIPNSMYDSEDNIIVITSPSLYPFEFSSYRYEVMGTDTDTYSMELTSVQSGESSAFTATDIPTSANAVHQYTIDWDALSLGEEGVTVEVDADGDGLFEHSFTSDGELSYSEYAAATHAIDTWITDSDFNEIENFRAVFTPYGNTELYKLTATNPGQFYFNILVNNTWSETLNLTIVYSIDANFTLKGAKPIHVYADLERTIDITANCTFSDNTITVYNVAPKAIIYVTIHLNYALKGTMWTAEEVEAWYSEHGFSATVRSITSKVVITDP